MVSNMQSAKLIQIFFNKKFVYMFVLIVILYSFFRFNRFLSVSPQQKNIYDLLLFTFNDFHYLFFGLSLMFLVLIYPISPSSSFHQYIVVKFKNRKNWLLVTIAALAIIALLYILGLVILCILESITTLGFENHWSQYGRSKYHFVTEQKPLTIAIVNLLLVYLYFFTLGLIVVVANLFIRNSIYSTMWAVGFQIFSIVVYLNRITSLYSFTINYHVLISKEVLIRNNFCEFVIVSILYWLILILVLILLGFMKIRKVDFIWRER